MKKAKLYSIYGKYGKAEFSTTEYQKDKNTSYNMEEYDIDVEPAQYLDGQDNIPELPQDITYEDYFRMSLLGAIRGLKNATHKTSDAVKDLKKENNNIREQLFILNTKLDKLVDTILLVNDTKNKK